MPTLAYSPSKIQLFRTSTEWLILTFSEVGILIPRPETLNGFTPTHPVSLITFDCSFTLKHI